MSYCVNCGVKLDTALETCPLCHTPVINPNELKSQPTNSHPSFSETKGEVEPMLKRDMGIWLTIVLSSTAISCLILNFTVFDHNLWSIPVSGACVLLWIFLCPKMLFHTLPFALCILASGAGILLYEYFLCFLTKENQWFYDLALPITLLSFFAAVLYGVLYKLLSHSLLATVLYFFIDVAIICIGVEFFVDRFIGAPLKFGWSAIVSSVCMVISIALITIMCIARLRDMVRKRLHF